MELSILNADVCLSGGALGSDLAWGMTAGMAGHGVIHFSFAGNKSLAPSSEIVILTVAQLQAADQYCERANTTLKRHWPPKSGFVRNLLRRNWYQVESATSCYAVSGFKLDGWLEIGAELDPRWEVQGGTAWATQMFIDKHHGAPCACYVFDQDVCNWFEWRGKWTRIYEPPKPSGIYAGIGTRPLHLIGKLAIRVLMDYKQDFHTANYPMLGNPRYVR
jgi:hypothetical protein